MKITDIRQANRAMDLAFRLSMKSLDKSDTRRLEIRRISDKLIAAAREYVREQELQFRREA